MTGIGLGVTNIGNKSFGIQTNNFSNSKNAVYATKGEPMYQKEMDADEDGVITFKEYMEYCKKQSENSADKAFSPKAEAVKTENPDTKQEQIVVKDYAKAFKSYANSESKAESKIENEA